MATFSAVSWASVSGLRISWIVIDTSRDVNFRRSFFRFSISAPFFPMTIPGRAVWMRTCTRLDFRSISTADTPAWISRPLT
jgi:hypothetical protein